MGNAAHHTSPAQPLLMRGPCPLAYTHQLSSHTGAEADPRLMKGHVLWAHGASPILTSVPCSPLPVSSLTTVFFLREEFAVSAVPYSRPAVHIHRSSLAHAWVSQAGCKLTVWLRMTLSLLVSLPQLPECRNTARDTVPRLYHSGDQICAR